MSASKTIVTDLGKTLIAKASATGTTVKLKYFAVGDGSGSEYTPTGKETKLVKENWRTNIGSISVNPKDDKELFVDTPIPEDVGGWWVREYGIFDEANNLILIGTTNEFYKAKAEEGDVIVVDMNLSLTVQNTANIEFIIDPDSYVTYKNLNNIPYARTDKENQFTNKNSFNDYTTYKGSEVAVVKSRVGENWLPTNLQDIIGNISICYGNGLYVLANSSGLFSSVDNINWLKCYDDAFTKVYFANGLFVASGSDAIYYSNDGINWVKSLSITSDLIFIYVNNLWLGLASNRSQVEFSSTDGKTWKQVKTLDYHTKAIVYFNRLYVKATTKGMLSSSDGTTWDKSEYTNSVNDLYYANGLFMAVTDSHIISSTDGKVWSIVYSLTGAKSIKYGNSLWVVVSTTGIYTSSNTTDWVQRYIGNFVNLAFDGREVWVANGYNNLSCYSIDGIKWYKSLSNVGIDVQYQNVFFSGNNTLYYSTTIVGNVYYEQINQLLKSEYQHKLTNEDRLILINTFNSCSNAIENKLSDNELVIPDKVKELIKVYSIYSNLSELIYKYERYTLPIYKYTQLEQEALTLFLSECIELIKHVTIKTLVPKLPDFLQEYV